MQKKDNFSLVSKQKLLLAQSPPHSHNILH